jgi:YbbR domain-containing protein
MDKWMKNNNFNKILALVIGMILWTIVHVDTEPTSQTTVRTQPKIIENVKIETIGMDEDKYVYSFDAESARVEVRGRSSDLNFKFSDAYTISLDLSEVGPGDHTLPIHYSLPNGVVLESIDPNEVNVHVELRNTKSFPITLDIQGSPAEGFQLGTPVIEPETAEVTMASSELGKVAKVQATVELEGEDDTFKEKKLKLYAYDSSGNEIKDAVIEPSNVSVELPITLPNKSLPLDISFSGQLPGNLVLSRVTPEIDTVTVYGSKEALAALSTYEAAVDLSSIASAGTEQLKVELKPPEGLSRIEPAAVNVTVSTAEIAERTIENIPIKLEGVGSGLAAQVTSPAGQAVTLTVSGAPTLLDQLDRDNISVVADVGGLAAGVHELALQVSLPRFISQVNAQPLMATVDLQSPASATPGVTEAPETGSTVTPEPSSEPASGEEIIPEPTPSSEGSATATPAPSPTDPPVESNSTPSNNGSSNAVNTGNTGGT